ncbi:TnsA endonuclease N-terminal domain-containing protein [Bosea sp. RAF48]|uniref:TnsA endonuclease N-terminal domain-containing protein n=1 Tax=unclassified Bosea (in: a-proteobacteria) TaxID=2653178 RepID=UPI003F8E083D
MNPIVEIAPSPAPIVYLPGESRSSRNVHSKSRGACRPSIIAGSVPYELMCESGLERDVALVLSTCPDIADIVEQPPAIDWTDAAGTRRRYTFDFLLTLLSGCKIAVAVKPWEKAQREGLDHKLRSMALQLPGGFADYVKLITDRDISLDLVHNAKLIRLSRRTSNPVHDAAVSTLLAKTPQSTVGQIVQASKLEGEGFQAVIRLIASGKARLLNDERISYAARIGLVTASNDEELA